MRSADVVLERERILVAFKSLRRGERVATGSGITPAKAINDAVARARALGALDGG